MKLSIYLGEDEILAVLGSVGKKIKILDCCRISLKKGTLINDVITDEASVCQALQEIRDRFYSRCKNVALILAGSQILTKVLEVPPMSPAQLRELARREMQEYILESEEPSYLYHYSAPAEPQNNKGPRTIICIAVKRQMIEQYIERFTQCKMPLKSIEAAFDGVSRLVHFQQGLHSKTFILAIADGRNLMTSLFINGVYAYTNRLRLVEERGRQACTEEIENAIRSVARFGKIRREEYRFENIYLCGLTKEECKVLIPNIQKEEQITVSVPEAGVDFQIAEGLSYSLSDFIFNTGSLLKPARLPDLISASMGNRKKARIHLLYMTALAALPAFMVFWTFASYMGHSQELRRIQSQIEDMEAAMNQGDYKQVKQAEELETILKALQEARETNENIERQLAEYPQMKSEIRNRIISEGRDAVTAFDLNYREGTVTFRGKASNYQEISAYVSRLESSGLFQSVEYYGFTDKNPLDGLKDGAYYFNISCILPKGEETQP